ncbi:Rpn family recombination-promoting nuclease/putative transposase [Clostridium chromiireducens]|uniref:Rpn family recombination-promoting nuclease/putative transposase n=1 Tax=Clostridium chromiireducens TaxID=225345 RepID=UPI00311A9DF0
MDFQMPMRLLFYMTEVWRDVLKNTEKSEIKRKSFKLPAIVPIVLYNGKNKWTAKTSFREILSGYELFEDNILNFNYMLFDINRYSDEELYSISNLVSAVFLLDQEISQEELIRRLRKMIYILKRISPEQFSVFKQWLKKIVKPRLTEEWQGEIDEVLDKSDQKEVDSMVHNLEKTLDNIEKKGMEKKVKEIAINAIGMGMDNEVIIKLTGLTDKEINEIRKERSH